MKRCKDRQKYTSREDREIHGQLKQMREKQKTIQVCRSREDIQEDKHRQKVK